VPSGERFECRADQSILEAAHAANILISYSCRGGQCGSCMGKLHRGDIIYPNGQPDAISEGQTELGYTLFCCAFARSDLIIELTGPATPDF
jgi:CDP-4-dehydro-6-deoxyglucose reductase